MTHDYFEEKNEKNRISWKRHTKNTHIKEEDNSDTEVYYCEGVIINDISHFLNSKGKS